MAARVQVKVTLHRAEIARAMRDPSGPAVLFVQRRCDLAVNYSKADCPVDEGRLRNSIHSRVVVEGNQVVGSVGSDLDYARYVHEGTGIYGPRRQFIYPRNGQYLVFEVKRPVGPLPKGKRIAARGSRPVVFARKVRGTPPSPFLVSGLAKAMPGVPIRRH